MADIVLMRYAHFHNWPPHGQVLTHYKELGFQGLIRIFSTIEMYSSRGKDNLLHQVFGGQILHK